MVMMMIVFGYFVGLWGIVLILVGGFIGVCFVIVMLVVV